MHVTPPVWCPASNSAWVVRHHRLLACRDRCPAGDVRSHVRDVCVCVAPAAPMYASYVCMYAGASVLPRPFQQAPRRRRSPNPRPHSLEACWPLRPSIHSCLGRDLAPAAGCKSGASPLLAPWPRANLAGSDTSTPGEARTRLHQLDLSPSVIANTRRGPTPRALLLTKAASSSSSSSPFILRRGAAPQVGSPWRRASA